MTANDDQETPSPEVPPGVERVTLELKPLSRDLEPEVYRFVVELRGIFGYLGISLGEFARRHYRDKSVLSRYLSGNRIPSRELLDELIAEVTSLLDVPLTMEMDSHLHKLHLGALESRDPRAYEIQVLTDHLDKSTKELWQARQRIKELEIQLTQLETALPAGRQLAVITEGESELAGDRPAETKRPLSGSTQLNPEPGKLPSIYEPLRRWDPERIGPYVVLGRLGSGSMGQVYLGRSAAGRLVAVKTIRVELAEESGFRTRFGQEVAAARKVSGVFTAAVVEADPEADLPWLATAYVPAPSLARLVLACGPLPVATVRWLAAGCAEALASIHGAGLVHRDLKPSNVLVAPDGPRVIDFGVARAAERMGRTTARGAVGTPAYMAPEQARDTREASVASDVYSLGATLLFAATGHPPYAGASVMDVLARLATEEPDLSGLPGELSEVITACLHRVPRQRPTSTAMLVQLGDFTVAQAGPDEEHSYLPDKVMALIAEYQRSPQIGPLGKAGEYDEDLTVASYTDLPVSRVRRNRERRFWNRIEGIFRLAGPK